MNFQNLTVEEITQSGNRIKITAGGKAYSFFATKQDQTISRAMQDYQRLNVSVGNTYSFGISETQGEYQGKPITYRNIGVISEVRNAPQTSQNAPAPQNIQTPTQPIQTPPASNQTPNNANEQPNNYTITAIHTLVAELEDMKIKFQAMEQEIGGFRTLMVDLKGEPAVELHTSMTGKTKEEESGDIPIIESGITEPEQESLIDEPNLPR